MKFNLKFYGNGTRPRGKVTLNLIGLNNCCLRNNSGMYWDNPNERRKKERQHKVIMANVKASITEAIVLDGNCT